MLAKTAGCVAKQKASGVLRIDFHRVDAELAGLRLSPPHGSTSNWHRVEWFSRQLPRAGGLQSAGSGPKFFVPVCGSLCALGL